MGSTQHHDGGARLTRFVKNDADVAVKDVFGPSSVGHFGQIGNQLGVWSDDSRKNVNQTLLLDTRQSTFAVFLAEVMNNGQDVYWHDASSVFTTLKTDARIGWAIAEHNFEETYPVVKTNTQPDVYIRVSRGRRDADSVVTLSAALQLAILTAAAPTLLLRNYSTDLLAIPKEGTVPAQFISGTFWHDGNVAVSGAATIALGTTPGGVDIMAATLVTVLVALGAAFTENAITLAAAAPIAAPAVYMTVAAADITAGKFRFRLENQAE